MVMWHIKLKGMISRPGYNEKFYPRIKTGDLGFGSKGQILLDFFRAWQFTMARHRMRSSVYLIMALISVLSI